jgi:acyl carrier protein
MMKASPVDLRNTVLAALLEVAPDVDPGTLDPHVAFRDQFDFDSMDHLNFAIALHSSLGVDIPEQDYARLGSLDGCVAYVAEALGRSGSTS